MAQGDVHRVVAAEAAPQAGQMGIPVLEPDEGQYLLHHVALVLHVPGDPPAGGHGPVVPALRIDAVQAIKLDLAVVDLVSDGPDQAAVLKFIEPPLRRWKDHHRHARVPEDQQFHIPPQAGRPPLVIFAIHNWFTILIL